MFDQEVDMTALGKWHEGRRDCVASPLENVQRDTFFKAKGGLIGLFEGLFRDSRKEPLLSQFHKG